MTLLYQREKRVKSLRSLAIKAILEDIISFCGDYVKLRETLRNCSKKGLRHAFPRPRVAQNTLIIDHEIGEAMVGQWLVYLDSILRVAFQTYSSYLIVFFA